MTRLLSKRQNTGPRFGRFCGIESHAQRLTATVQYATRWMRNSLLFRSTLYLLTGVSGSCLALYLRDGKSLGWQFKSKKGNQIMQTLTMEVLGNKQKHFIWSMVAGFALNLVLVGCSSSGNAPQVSPPPSTQKNYTTSFPGVANPISEGGNWINGHADGLDWADVRTTAGLAFGTESGSGAFDDSTAVLAGTWGPEQTTQATVHTVNQQTNSISEEVELRLRTTITPHSITGYEINFRCTSDGSQYVQIVRWNGPLGSFDIVDTTTGPGIHDGDVIKATISGSLITAYINGAQVLQGSDATYTNGSPGIGFFLLAGTNLSGDFGLTNFTATASAAPSN